MWPRQDNVVIEANYQLTSKWSKWGTHFGMVPFFRLLLLLQVWNLVISTLILSNMLVPKYLILMIQYFIYFFIIKFVLLFFSRNRFMPVWLFFFFLLSNKLNIKVGLMDKHTNGKIIEKRMKILFFVFWFFFLPNLKFKFYFIFFFIEI